jgi:hypothetical protein
MQNKRWSGGNPEQSGSGILFMATIGASGMPDIDV